MPNLKFKSGIAQLGFVVLILVGLAVAVSFSISANRKDRGRSLDVNTIRCGVQRITRGEGRRGESSTSETCQQNGQAGGGTVPSPSIPERSPAVLPTPISALPQSIVSRPSPTPPPANI